MNLEETSMKHLFYAKLVLYPERNVPSHASFYRVVNKFSEDGNVDDERLLLMKIMKSSY